MADRDTAMINFRLNLSKREDKEIYDYLQNFDSPDFKAVLKGGKSNFIKMVLLSFIHKEKQEQEAIKALAERKTQNEELVEMMGARLDGNQRTLLQALPKLVEKVVLEALKGKIVAGVKNCVGDGDSVADGIGTKVATEVEIDNGALPQVTEELPFRLVRISVRQRSSCKTFCKAKSQSSKAVLYYKKVPVICFVLQAIIFDTVYPAMRGCNYMGCRSPCQDEKMIAA